MTSIALNLRLFFDALQHWMDGKRIWLMSINFAVLGCLVFVTQYPLVNIKSVSIEGPDAWRDIAMEIAKPASDSNLFRYDFDAVGRRLDAAFGARARCQVRYDIPASITVVLTPSDPMLWTESGRGIRADGMLFVAEVQSTSSPIWRPEALRKGNDLQSDASLAAGVWAEVVAADPRFEQGASEWTRDAGHGWIMMAGDGRTRVILGWNNLEERTRSVGRLLEYRDSTMVNGCTIDARFDGRLIVRSTQQTVSARSTADFRQEQNSTVALRLPAAGSRRQGG